MSGKPSSKHKAWSTPGLEDNHPHQTCKQIVVWGLVVILHYRTRTVGIRYSTLPSVSLVTITTVHTCHL